MTDLFKPDLTIVGGGLAGSEAAWQAAQRGALVHLYEMRPISSTGAHRTGDLGELVCSNSLGSKLPDHASGMLLTELNAMGSLLAQCALQAALPAGSALAVDRGMFASTVTKAILTHPYIRVIREEVLEIPGGPVIIATGPLTSPRLAENIALCTGKQNLFFFDAIAPTVEAETIDFTVAFRASRYQEQLHEQADYVNCPFTADQYDSFVEELLLAQKVSLREFEKDIQSGVKAGAGHFFEGCLPVEILAARGRQALAYGPMRPVGLTNPHDGTHPHAVVQLRQENQAGTLYNMVGFQTNLTYSEQERVFRLIPGMENAQFTRLGQMHRNTFIASPLLLRETLQHIDMDTLLFAGQIIGVEGYLGNIASGLLAGLNATRIINGQTPLSLPVTTMLGALIHQIIHTDMGVFQPIKANLGLLPKIPIQRRIGKKEHAALLASRARADLAEFIDRQHLVF